MAWEEKRVTAVCSRLGVPTPLSFLPHILQMRAFAFTSKDVSHECTTWKRNSTTTTITDIEKSNTSNRGASP